MSAQPIMIKGNRHQKFPSCLFTAAKVNTIPFAPIISYVFSSAGKASEILFIFPSVNSQYRSMGASECILNDIRRIFLFYVREVRSRADVCQSHPF